MAPKATPIEITTTKSRNRSPSKRRKRLGPRLVSEHRKKQGRIGELAIGDPHETVSTKPPKKPAIRPSETPMARPRLTETRPTISEVRRPKATRRGDCGPGRRCRAERRSPCGIQIGGVNASRIEEPARSKGSATKSGVRKAKSASAMATKAAKVGPGAAAMPAEVSRKSPPPATPGKERLRPSCLPSQNARIDQRIARFEGEMISM